MPLGAGQRCSAVIFATSVHASSEFREGAKESRYNSFSELFPAVYDELKKKVDGFLGCFPNQIIVIILFAIRQLQAIPQIFHSTSQFTMLMLLIYT